MRSRAVSVIAAIAMAAMSPNALMAEQEHAFVSSDFVPFTGILPNGEFGFAIEVTSRAGGLEGQPEFSPGTFITRVHVNRPNEAVATQGQQEMIDLLASIGPGDTAFIDVVEPDGSVPERVTFALISDEERFALALAAARAQRLADQAALAEASFQAGDPFGGSYWGVRLRHLELGNFETLRAMIDAEAEGMEAFIDQFTGDELSFIPWLVGGLMRIEGHLKPNAGLISAYAITRATILGACGEPMREITQTTEAWTEYRNGVGTYTGASTSTFSTRAVTVPEKFASIVLASGDITVNFLADMNLSAIVQSMSCEDSRRMDLEDNMLAFHAGGRAVARSLSR